MSHMYTRVPLLNTLILGQKDKMLEISNARIEWKLIYHDGINHNLIQYDKLNTSLVANSCDKLMKGQKPEYV